MKTYQTVLFTMLLVSQFFILPATLAGYSSLGLNPVPTVLAQNGATEFGTNIRVTDDSSPYANQVEPTMTILSDGRILVGWKEAEQHGWEGGAGRRVGFAYSTDGGVTFSSNILMTRLSSNNFQSDPWLVSDANDHTYFVWMDYNDARYPPEGCIPPEGIGVAKTTDGGETWASTVNAADTLGFDEKPTACIDSLDNLYIVWGHLIYNSSYHLVSYDYRLTSSTDGGATFSPTTIPAEPLISDIHCSANDTLYISHLNDTFWFPNTQMFITRSDDRGITWTPSVLVYPMSWFEEVALFTVVDTDSQHNVYVAFAAGTSDDKDIWVAKSTDGGKSWNIFVQVNDDSTGMQRMVEMYIDQDDTIHVAWLDASLGEWNIFYSYSTDGGDTFSANERITELGFSFYFDRPGDYFCMRPAPNGDMCIVWTDGRNGVDHDIYFARQGLVLTPLIPFPVEWLLVIVAIVVVGIVIVVVVWFFRRRGE